MPVYHHVLVLINSSQDGVPLLSTLRKWRKKALCALPLPISVPTTGH